MPPTPPRPALLGLDLGTSSLKALLLGVDGRVLAERSAAYPTRTPAPGWAEQDPDDWWAAAGEATRAVLADAPDADVLAIGLSGQMHTVVLLGAHARPVRPAVTWMDTRAAPLLPSIAATIAAAGLQRELANPVVAGLTLPPLVWLARHDPAALAATRTLLLAKDALRYRLTGELGSEPTDASATLLFDVARRAWSTATLAAFGIPERVLPPLGDPAARAGALTLEAARHLRLRAGIPVAFGAGDQQAAAVGMGTLAPGQVQLMVGTGAQALQIAGEPPHGEPPADLHAFCHVRGWVTQASVNNAGVALDWARALLGGSWSEVAAAADAPPPATPLFLPYLTGERAPVMKGYARGAFVGLDLGHDRAALLQAAVAGVVAAIAAGLRALPGPSARVVRAGGGGLRSGFAQAIADASGATLEVRDVRGASAVGAALLGGVAAGVFPDVEAAIARMPTPVTARHTPRLERADAWARLRDRAAALDAVGLHEVVAEGVELGDG